MLLLLLLLLLFLRYQGLCRESQHNVSSHHVVSCALLHVRSKMCFSSMRVVQWWTLCQIFEGGRQSYCFSKMHCLFLLFLNKGSLFSPTLGLIAPRYPRGESRAKIAYEISQISEIPQNFEGISGFLVGFPWICGISKGLTMKDMFAKFILFTAMTKAFQGLLFSFYFKVYFCEQREASFLTNLVLK